MDALDALSEAAIRELASEASYRRGEDYSLNGSVLGISRRGDLVQAEVEGSGDEVYEVTIALHQNALPDAECTCPYDWDGACKHIVAVLLLCLRQPDEIEEKPSLESLLEGLDRNQLQALLLELAGEWAGVANGIEAHVRYLYRLEDD